MKTLMQREPVTFSVTIDCASAAVIALYAKDSPSAYAAGVLIAACQAACVLRESPVEVAHTAMVDYFVKKKHYQEALR